jgi:sugar phosphate isomerase/epimerase
MPKLGTYEAWFDGEVVVPGVTLEERLANLQAWGYDGIQLQRKTLQEYTLADLKRAFAQSSVKLCIHGGGGGLLASDPRARQAGVEQVKQGLREAADLGALGSIIVPIRVQPEIAPPLPPKTLWELEREILIEELFEIAPVAEETGAKVILEPLNRYESHFLKQLGQAAEICRTVGNKSITFMADFFHMNLEEVDLGQAIEENADYLSYVHLADSNRYEPGAGHLDFRPGLAALKRTGYAGYLTLECRILGADKGRALTESARLIRRLWDEV